MTDAVLVIECVHYWDCAQGFCSVHILPNFISVIAHVIWLIIWTGPGEVITLLLLHSPDVIWNYTFCYIEYYCICFHNKAHMHIIQVDGTLV